MLKGLAAALGACLLAFAAGRYTAAEPDVHEESVVTVQQWSRTRYVRQSHTVTERTFVGNLLATERIEERTLESSDATAGSRSDATAERTTTAARPQWVLGLHGGAQLVPELSPRVGLSLDRRIAGPFFLGGMVLVRPAPLVVEGLVSLKVEW